MQTLRISKTKGTTKNKFTVDLIALGCEKKILSSRRVLICLSNFSLRKKHACVFWVCFSFSHFWELAVAFKKKD